VVELFSVILHPIEFWGGLMEDKPALEQAVYTKNTGFA
jgi:hypothetical protein